MQRKSANDLPEQLKLNILRRDGWRCQICGYTNNLHIHHILFRSHGGKSTADNLICLCATCHDAVHRRG
jgi:5-methylcytosine-specific restriction endonuclease McrA